MFSIVAEFDRLLRNLFVAHQTAQDRHQVLTLTPQVQLMLYHSDQDNYALHPFAIIADQLPQNVPLRFHLQVTSPLDLIYPARLNLHVLPLIDHVVVALAPVIQLTDA